MYEGQDHRDSCSSGGWYYTVYGYVKMKKRLATYNSYPYTGFGNNLFIHLTAKIPAHHKIPSLDVTCNHDNLPRCDV